MKNANKMIAIALLALAIATRALAFDEVKSKVTLINKVLPASSPALDGPAPQRVNISAENAQKSAVQKANIVELKLKSITK
jgi:hypothetical protein